MSQTAEQWFKELATEAGYSEQQTSDLLKLVSNDKAAGKVNTVLKTAQDDYSAQVGRVRALDEAVRTAEAKANSVLRWYNGEYDAQGKKISQGAIDAYNAALAERDAALAKLSGGGTLTPEQTGKFVSKDDLTKMLAERDGRFASVIKEVGRVASRHAARFHEELDTDALETLATEKGLTVTQAYDLMVKPRVDELEKTRIQKEKDEYADQKVKDALSRHKLPVDPVPQETAPLYRHIPADQIPKDMDGELLAAWHGGK